MKTKLSDTKRALSGLKASSRNIKLTISIKENPTQ